jgi:hypothetical protein
MLVKKHKIWSKYKVFLDLEGREEEERAKSKLNILPLLSLLRS